MATKNTLRIENFTLGFSSVIDTLNEQKSVWKYVPF